MDLLLSGQEIGVLAGNRSFTKKRRTRIATIKILVLFHSKFDKFKVRQFQVRQLDNSKLDKSDVNSKRIEDDVD